MWKLSGLDERIQANLHQHLTNNGLHYTIVIDNVLEVVAGLVEFQHLGSERVRNCGLVDSNLLFSKNKVFFLVQTRDKLLLEKTKLLFVHPLADLIFRDNHRIGNVVLNVVLMLREFVKGSKSE